MVIKYVKIFQSKAVQNLPKLGFLVLKETIWRPCSRRAPMLADQGDQIGRIFAHWAVAYSLDRFFENFRSSSRVLATFPLIINCVLMLSKMVLGDFFRKLIRSPCVGPSFSLTCLLSLEHELGRGEKWPKHSVYLGRACCQPLTK
jgi:hypothetical protein